MTDPRNIHHQDLSLSDLNKPAGYCRRCQDTGILSYHDLPGSYGTEPCPDCERDYEQQRATGADWSREGPEPLPFENCGWCGQEYDPDFVDPNFTGYCSRGCATACWSDSQD